MAMDLGVWVLLHYYQRPTELLWACYLHVTDVMKVITNEENVFFVCSDFLESHGGKVVMTCNIDFMLHIEFVIVEVITNYCTLFHEKNFLYR